METLTCTHGHTFTRVVKRGRKPTLCPQHLNDAIVNEVTGPIDGYSDEEEISSRPAVTGVERASRLFANMALLTKTTRTVIEH